jgi:hypothetical protein
VHDVPERWRFRFDDEDVSLDALSWPQAVRVFHDAAVGELSGQADDECVSLEFDATHAAVLYMGRGGVILRPYFPNRPAATQDLGPFFCGACGIRLGPKNEYLARFVGREDGFRLFRAVLIGPCLPSQLPDPHPGQPFLPGFEAAAELAAERVLEWRPLPSRECKHSGPGAALDRGDG